MPPSRVIRSDVRDWPVLNPLLPHAQAVAGHADAAGITAPTVRLMNQLGVMYLTKSLHAEAEPLMRRALAIDEASFGPDHPNVARRPQQPGATASGHQPPGRGRAADAAGAGH